MTGDEYTRTTVLRGQLLELATTSSSYAIGNGLVLYESHTLEGSPAPDGSPVPTTTQFGARTDLGGDLLPLDATVPVAALDGNRGYVVAPLAIMGREAGGERIQERPRNGTLGQ